MDSRLPVGCRRTFIKYIFRCAFSSIQRLLKNPLPVPKFQNLAFHRVISNLGETGLNIQPPYLEIKKPSSSQGREPEFAHAVPPCFLHEASTFGYGKQLIPFLYNGRTRLTYLPAAFSLQLRKDFQSIWLIRFSPSPDSLAAKTIYSFPSKLFNFDNYKGFQPYMQGLLRSAEICGPVHSIRTSSRHRYIQCQLRCNVGLSILSL